MPATEIKLDETAVYLSPSGRCCRWYRDTSSMQRPGKGAAMFLYELPDGNPPAYTDDGFSLSRENWHLLRRLA